MEELGYRLMTMPANPGAVNDGGREALKATVAGTVNFTRPDIR
ncbi:hypothetical protein [Actinospica robiniae]|nr:hypothetical protein [Actinospica robiniae]